MLELSEDGGAGQLGFPFCFSVLEFSFSYYE